MKDGRLKVFISWSGEQSLQVAQVLYDWLPQVLQTIQPYLSVEDTVKGTYWSAVVKHELAESDFGLICLTSTNLTAPWISFEAGALSNSIDQGYVTPFLFGVAPTEVIQPLAQFQVTEASKAVDVLRLVKDLDSACGTMALGEKRVEISFRMWWPHLEAALANIAPPELVGQRSMQDMVLEVLNSQRALERFVTDVAGRPFMEALARQAAVIPGPELRAQLEDVLQSLADALAACDSDDPAIKKVADHEGAVRMLHEKLTGGRRAMWKPLRERVNPDQRGLAAGGA
jgi:hypothetical protein